MQYIHIKRNQVTIYLIYNHMANPSTLQDLHSMVFQFVCEVGLVLQLCLHSYHPIWRIHLYLEIY